MRLTIERGINKVLRPLDLQLVHRGQAALARTSRIVFFHVPKCGGSSIGHGLRSTFGHMNVDERRENFNLDASAAQRSANAVGVSFAQQNRFLLRYALEKNIRLIQGHFLFDELALAGLRETWEFITILRDPIKQVLSGYYYDRYKPTDREHFGIDVDIEEWLETKHARGYGVSFVSYFVGDPDLADAVPGFANDSAEMDAAVERAIRNLESFAVVGNVGNVPGLEAAIGEKFEVNIKFEHVKRTPVGKYPSFADHGEAVQQRLRELCVPNERVFRHFFG